MEDPYRTLGVERKASAEDIKAAYRKLAKKLHPDLNPGNRQVENQFKEATAAYEFLSDAERRRQYDQGEIDANGQPRFRQARSPWGERPRASGQSKDFVFEEEGGGFAEDLFRDVFGFGRERGSARTMRMRGADVSYRADVDFIDAALGGKRRLSLTDGKVIDVAIPPGTENGQTLRLKGQGLPGAGGAPAGDAFIEISVRLHPFFIREDLDIWLDLPVTLEEAALGASIHVPTLAGRVALKIPPSSNSGTQLRLKGKGISKGGKTGDQYVKLIVMLPPQIDPELKSAIQKSAEKYPYRVRQKLGE